MERGLKVLSAFYEPNILKSSDGGQIWSKEKKSFMRQASLEKVQKFFLGKFRRSHLQNFLRMMLRDRKNFYKRKCCIFWVQKINFVYLKCRVTRGKRRREKGKGREGRERGGKGRRTFCSLITMCSISALMMDILHLGPSLGYCLNSGMTFPSSPTSISPWPSTKSSLS